uniref:(northern house mosquito) hypothetical protein n=1 Tax=Culex pipiens TaxID=7175 RepID=A0A8D8JPI2_CULPI
MMFFAGLASSATSGSTITVEKWSDGVSLHLQHYDNQHHRERGFHFIQFSSSPQLALFFCCSVVKSFYTPFFLVAASKRNAISLPIFCAPLFRAAGEYFYLFFLNTIFPLVQRCRDSSPAG